MARQRNERVEKFAAWIALRIVWFIGVSFLSAIALFYQATPEMVEQFELFYIVPMVVGLIAAFVGPPLFGRARTRGRGTLADVKARTKAQEESMRDE